MKKHIHEIPILCFVIHLDEAVPEVKQTFFIVAFASYTSSRKDLKKERKKETYEIEERKEGIFRQNGDTRIQ